MDKWQYMFVTRSLNEYKTLAALDEAGRNGWEVVCYFWGRFLLKRRVAA